MQLFNLVNTAASVSNPSPLDDVVEIAAVVPDTPPDAADVLACAVVAAIFVAATVVAASVVAATVVTALVVGATVVRTVVVVGAAVVVVRLDI